MAPRKDTKAEVSMERIETKLDLFKEHIDKQLSSVDSKLDRIDSRVDVIEVTLGKQHSSLEEHIRRTNLLEQKIHNETTDLGKRIDAESKAVVESLEPIKMQSKQVKMILKIIATILGAGAAGGGAGLGIHKLVEIILS